MLNDKIFQVRIFEKIRFGKLFVGIKNITIWVLVCFENFRVTLILCF